MKLLNHITSDSVEGEVVNEVWTQTVEQVYNVLRNLKKKNVFF